MSRTRAHRDPLDPQTGVVGFRWWAVAASVVSVALLAACTSGPGQPPVSYTSKYGPIVLIPAPVDKTMYPGTIPVTPEARREPAPSSLSLRTPWSVVNPQPSSSTLQIVWGDGFPGCGAVNALYLTSDVNQVIIDLAEAPMSAGTNCAASLRSVSTTVQLDQPLGNRIPVRHGVSPH